MRCVAELYDLYGDVGETENIAASQPEIVARLTMMAESARAELGDTDLEGSGQRLAGWCDDPQPCRQNEQGQR